MFDRILDTHLTQSTGLSKTYYNRYDALLDFKGRVTRFDFSLLSSSPCVIFPLSYDFNRTAALSLI